MAKHLRYIEGYSGTLEELAQAIGNMTYDETACFIEKFANDIKRQADKDLANKKPQLASQLYAAANNMYKAKKELDIAWNICKKYME